MAARLLLIRGDTAAAVDSLRVIRPAASFPHLVWRYWQALAPERMLLASLLLARARPSDALRVADSFDGQRTVVDVAYLRPSLELRLRAADELNNSHLRKEYAQRLAALNR